MRAPILFGWCDGGDEAIASGIIKGRLNITPGDKERGTPARQEIIVDSCVEVDGETGPVNFCQFVGRAGRDPEVKYFDSGSVVAKFSIAVNRRQKDSPPDWVNVEVWGKPAQVAADYVRKGHLIGVEGSLKIESWEKEGGQYSKPVVKVSQVHLLGSRKDNEAYAQQHPAATPTAVMPKDIDYSDIPF